MSSSEKKYGFDVVRLALLVVMALLLSGENGYAAGHDKLVGSWYSETKGDGEFEGAKYTIRRQLAVNKADGTKANIYRYYDGTRLVGEHVNSYQWGVNKNVFWTVCQTTAKKGSVEPCSDKVEYEILSLTERAFQYKSRSSNIIYDAVRQDEAFRLP